MSVHLIECAAELELDVRFTATHKLAMLCFADSGSAETRVARPGLEGLMRWTGAKRSWALEVVNDLVEWQLLARHRRAFRGQRAEFVVFPNGCCERHGKVPADVRTVEPVDVVDAVSEPSEKGSAPPDPLPSSGYPQRPVVADPVSSNGSADGPAMGPPATEKGSASAPGKGPVATLKSGALQVPPPEEPPTAPTPESHLPEQPSPARDPSPVISIDFTVGTDPPRGVTVAPPAGGRPVGCRHCDAGWICDGDGLPLERCPHCHPAHRSNGATA